MRQDYLKKMIEQMGRVLGSILARMIDTGGKDGVLRLEELKAEIQEEGLSIDELLASDAGDVPQFLKEHHVSQEYADLLADILFRFGEMSVDADAGKKFYKTSLSVCHYASAGGKNYSKSREDLCARIQERLSLL